MKFMKHLKIIALILTATLLSCTNHDPVTNTYTNCNDVNYYGLRTATQRNTLGQIDVITNSSNNITNTVFNAQYSFNYTESVGNNSATYDANTQTMVFLDEWNINNTLIVYDLASNTHQQLSLASTNVLSAPIFIGGRLYVIEFENFPGTNVFLKEITNISTGTLSNPLLTIPKTNFDRISDTMSNNAYSATNGFDKIYFLGSTLLEIQIIPGYPYSTKSIPSTNQYLDIVHIQTGDLLTVSNDGSSTINLVKWNIANSTITETIQVPNIDVNTESIALVYKECADRLHILTHKRFDESIIHEINIQNNSINTINPPGFIFGIIHKN